MSTNQTGRVLVATSGSDASRSAIVHAAHEAVARGLLLELVHVITPTIAVGPYAASPDAALRRCGRELLAQGERLAHQVEPRVDVTTTLLTGSHPDAVVHYADGADLLVVGAPPHDLMGRLWTGSTVMGIAARATCPVVVVRPGEPRPTTHQVLVGLKTTRRCGRLLATAFAVASQTQSELRILHSWHLMSPYDEAIAERLPSPAWEQEDARVIEGELIDLRMAYPDVQVQVDVVHGHPAHTLVEASRAADTIVISRPSHGGLVHHLGATARAVIRDAGCPVLVVPPVDETAEVERVHVETALTP